MKESPLTALHRRLGATMHNDTGWNMPLQYTDLIREHIATRSSCAIFDISDLGKFRVIGNGALSCLEQLLSNNISLCRDGQLMSSLLLRAGGTILDRVSVCRESAGQFFLVGSASQAEADYESLQRDIRHGALELKNLTDSLCGIALLGPDAPKILSKVHFGIDVPKAGAFNTFRRGGQRCVLTCAGLVGENSLELFCPAASGIAWFEQLMTAGAIPCGTRTREYLRVERGRADVARDASDLTPAQAGLASLCSLDKWQQADTSTESSHQLVSLSCAEGSPALSEGNPVVDQDGKHVGNITSAAVSPANGRCVAIAYISKTHSTPGTHLRVQNGEHSVQAQVKAQS